MQEENVFIPFFKDNVSKQRAYRMEHINSVQKIAKKETREISVHENGLFFGLLHTHTHTHTQANWVYTKMAKRDKESDREKERKTGRGKRGGGGREGERQGGRGREKEKQVEREREGEGGRERKRERKREREREGRERTYRALTAAFVIGNRASQIGSSVWLKKCDHCKKN